MRRRIAVTLGSLGLVAAIAVPAIGQVTGDTNASELVATLTGSAQVPPVQTATAGIAHVTIDVDKRLICYDLHVTGKSPVAVHIHEGAAGVNGPIAVDFGSFGQAIKRNSEGCTRKIAKNVLSAIANNPDGYYVNVHTTQNPGGEVRGQLSS